MKDPRRLTDICLSAANCIFLFGQAQLSHSYTVYTFLSVAVVSGEHYRHLERSVTPAAIRAVRKCRNDIESIWPDYFKEFDAAPATAEAQTNSDQFPLLSSFVAFVENSNFQSDSNKERMNLQNRVRLALHQSEARVLYLLKSHVELVEAYRWHQISARRQENVLLGLRSGSLAPDALLVQMDSKENVRYPMSC